VQLMLGPPENALPDRSRAVRAQIRKEQFEESVLGPVNEAWVEDCLVVLDEACQSLVRLHIQRVLWEIRRHVPRVPIRARANQIHSVSVAPVVAILH
jgi:hypothetical protein